MVRRYDDLTAYFLGREEATAGSVSKWVLPFLKANGATDYLLREAYAEAVRITPGAPDSIRFISEMMPTFVCTSTYEHAWMHVAENIDAPLCEVCCSTVDLDQVQFGRMDSRAVRSLCDEITALRIPKTAYELNKPMEVDPADLKIIKTLDRVLQDELPGMPAMALMESANVVTSHRKAYRMLDVRKQTGIDLDCTMFVGGDDTDYQCLDLVRDAGGVSVSFNGSDFAVRGSSVAVLSPDATVVAVLATLFHYRGLEAILDLAANWNRDYLRKCEFPDRNVMDRMLAAHPRRLPEVYAVDRDNVDEVAQKSAERRRKMLRRGPQVFSEGS